MNKKGKSFWDYLAWICLGGITLWLILKLAGIINTPLWLEYSPLSAAIYIGGRYMQKLDNLEENIKEVKENIKENKNSINNVEKEITFLKEKYINQ